MAFINELVTGYHSAQGMAQQLQEYRQAGIDLGSSQLPAEVLDEIDRQLGVINRYSRAEEMGYTFYSVFHPVQALRDSYDRTESVLNEVRPI